MKTITCVMTWLSNSITFSWRYGAGWIGGWGEFEGVLGLGCVLLKGTGSQRKCLCLQTTRPVISKQCLCAADVSRAGGVGELKILYKCYMCDCIQYMYVNEFKQCISKIFLFCNHTSNACSWLCECVSVYMYVCNILCMSVCTLCTVLYVCVCLYVRL